MSKEQKHCLTCNEKLGKYFGIAKEGWDVPEGSWLCWDCWYERKKPHEVSRAENKSVHYSGEFVTVIEILGSNTRPAWNKVDELVKNGYSIKGIIEEGSFTGWVILEKMRRQV